MLQRFTYQHFKKRQAEKLESSKAEEVLSKQDETYLERFVHSAAPDTPQEVPLSDPSRLSAQDTASRERSASPKRSSSPFKHDWKSDIADRARAAKAVGVDVLPAWLHSIKKDDRKKDGTTIAANVPLPPDDAELTEEEKELHEALDKLNLAAQDGKAFSLSAETKELLNKFVQILKDMMNGVPEAYNDLIHLFETSATQIEKLFENIPGFMKKLIKQIPLGPPTAEGSKAEGFDLAAKAATLGIPTLKELVKNPGSVAAMLKNIMNVLKLRFPGLAMGPNVLISLGLFVLLFVFWYCYKRGKEVRLQKEAEDAEKDTEILGVPALEATTSVENPLETPASSIAPVEATTEPVHAAHSSGVPGST